MAVVRAAAARFICFCIFIEMAFTVFNIVSTLALQCLAKFSYIALSNDDDDVNEKDIFKNRSNVIASIKFKSV